MPTSPQQLSATHSNPPNSVDRMTTHSTATVLSVIEPLGTGTPSGVARRLAELGFLPGETVTVLRRGPGGREPIAVQIGETVFALRSMEASCIQVTDGVVEGQS